MDIIRFSIENPVKVAVGVILIVLFGVIALNSVPIQLTPDVDRPIVTVRTEWPGRSPEEIEESILIEQEEKLKTVQGLWKMVSTAQLGRANITLEFNVGVEMTRALQEVANTLDEVPSYPDDVDRPVIRASDTASDDAVAYCLLQAEDPDFEIAEFYDYADRYMKPALERIPGVAEIGIYGGREHEVQVQFDPVALAQRGISVPQLRSALQSDNVNESAGDMANGRQEVRFRVLGQFDSLEPIRRTIITYDDHGVPIRVQDVAGVDLVLEKKVHFDQCKGRTSMTIFVKRETGTNVLEIMEGVRKQIAEFNAPGGLLRSYKNNRYGINLRLVVDDTYYIQRAIGLVRENLMLGGCLAVLILLLFLRSPRPTLIIAIAIPISVMGTFVVMALTGRNMNVISLAGLSFAVGMVVDNAIVVLENIDRHLAMGEKAFEAAYRGAKEVWGAILSSTLTTIAVFAPVLTIQEESGQTLLRHRAGDLRCGEPFADCLDHRHSHGRFEVPPGSQDPPRSDPQGAGLAVWSGTAADLAVRRLRTADLFHLPSERGGCLAPSGDCLGDHGCGSRIELGSDAACELPAQRQQELHLWPDVQTRPAIRWSRTRRLPSVWKMRCGLIGKRKTRQKRRRLGP